MQEQTTPPTEPTALGPYLRRTREQAGLSLRHIAAQVGIHASYLARIECGDYRQPSPEVLQKLSRALGISYSDLFAMTGYRIPEDLPSLPGYLRSRYDMRDDDIQKVTAYVEQLNATRRPTSADTQQTPFHKQNRAPRRQGMGSNTNEWWGR